MSQLTFHSESSAAMRDAAHRAIGRLSVAIRSIKRFAAELVIIGLLAVATIAVKLVAIAVSNATVADALVNGSLFF